MKINYVYIYPVLAVVYTSYEACKNDEHIEGLTVPVGLICRILTHTLYRVQIMSCRYQSSAMNFPHIMRCSHLHYNFEDNLFQIKPRYYMLEKLQIIMTIVVVFLPYRRQYVPNKNQILYVE